MERDPIRYSWHFRHMKSPIERATSIMRDTSGCSLPVAISGNSTVWILKEQLPSIYSSGLTFIT